MSEEGTVTLFANGDVLGLALLDNYISMTGLEYMDVCISLTGIGATRATDLPRRQLMTEDLPTLCIHG